MKKVGIITFHCSYNYGSVLQTYALQTYLNSLGYDVQVIDFVSETDFEQYKLFRTKLYKNNSKSFFSDLLFVSPHIRRKLTFEKFLKSKLNLTEKTYYKCHDLSELNDLIDIFVCGSDQIWNIDCTNGVEPAYFLKFVEDEKLKIAYAPSLAHVEFAIDGKDELKVLIERLDFVSVREESTLPYLKSFCEKDITITVDPTLLLSANDYSDLTIGRKINEKYIFVYYLEINKELISYCEKVKESTGYKIYYVSSKVNSGMKSGKNLFGISPSEFLDYIRGAEYVITSSFHATVFSILFQKQFCVFNTSKSFSRVTDLLGRLELKDRIFNEGFDIDACIKYKIVMNKLDELRKSSYLFLEEALNTEIEQ